MPINNNATSADEIFRHFRIFMKLQENEFYKEVIPGLSSCQWVEEYLKRYLNEAFLLAKHCIGNRLPFKYTGTDVAAYSLERLIETFRRFTNDDQLIADLRKFKDERNFLRHQAITCCHDPEGFCGQTAFQVRPRLQMLHANANDLCQRINALSSHLLVERVFEDLDATVVTHQK